MPNEMRELPNSIPDSANLGRHTTWERSDRLVAFALRSYADADSEVVFPAPATPSSPTILSRPDADLLNGGALAGA